MGDGHGNRTHESANGDRDANSTERYHDELDDGRRFERTNSPSSSGKNPAEWSIGDIVALLVVCLGVMLIAVPGCS